MTEPSQQPPVSQRLLFGGAFLVVGLLLGTILATSAASSRKEAVAPADPQLVGLTAKIEELQKSLATLRSSVFTRQVEDDQYERVSLDVTSKAYHRIDTNLGTLFFVVDDVQPFANGQKITLDFGNPLNVDFVGLTIEFSFNGGHRKTESSTALLRRGTWTRVPVILSPLPADQLDSIYMYISLNQISLLRSK